MVEDSAANNRLNAELEELAQSIEDELYNTRAFNRELEKEISELRNELDRTIQEIKQNM